MRKLLVENLWHDRLKFWTCLNFLKGGKRISETFLQKFSKVEDKKKHDSVNSNEVKLFLFNKLFIQ